MPVRPSFSPRAAETPTSTVNPLYRPRGPPPAPVQSWSFASSTELASEHHRHRHADEFALPPDSIGAPPSYESAVQSPGSPGGPWSTEPAGLGRWQNPPPPEPAPSPGRREQHHGPGRPSALPGPAAPHAIARRRPMTNPFGTREEIESEDYQSPVAQMFGRAWNRYREVQERTAAAARAHELEQRENGDVTMLGTGPPPRGADIDMEQALALERFSETRIRLERLGFDAVEDSLSLLDPRPRLNPIDRQERPPPLSTEDMTFTIACRICAEQKVDTVLEPCMHVAICRWCAEITQEEARRRRRRRERDYRWKCPICRSNVSVAKRVFLA